MNKGGKAHIYVSKGKNVNKYQIFPDRSTVGVDMSECTC